MNLTSANPLGKGKVGGEGVVMGHSICTSYLVYDSTNEFRTVNIKNYTSQIITTKFISKINISTCLDWVKITNSPNSRLSNA